MCQGLILCKEVSQGHNVFDRVLKFTSVPVDFICLLETKKLAQVPCRHLLGLAVFFLKRDHVQNIEKKKFFWLK